MSEAVTLAGTVVSISAGTPATYDQTGFEALTYTEVGEVISPPTGGGRVYEDVSYTLLKERATVHLKGTYDEAEVTFQMITSRSDAGQVLMKAAHLSDNFYAFKVQYPDGDVDYYQARVFGLVDETGEANAIRTLSVTMRKHSNGVIDIAGPGAVSFTLTYTAGANGSILGTSPQTVNIGDDGTAVAAVPAATYAFVEWSDGKTENPRQDKYIQGDVTVTATFALA